MKIIVMTTQKKQHSFFCRLFLNILQYDPYLLYDLVNTPLTKFTGVSSDRRPHQPLTTPTTLNSSNISTIIIQKNHHDNNK